MNMESLIPILAAALVALPGLLALWSQFRRDKADVAEKYRKMLHAEIDKCNSIENKYDEIKSELRGCNHAYDLQARYIKRLQGQITSLGHESVKME